MTIKIKEKNKIKVMKKKDSNLKGGGHVNR